MPVPVAGPFPAARHYIRLVALVLLAVAGGIIASPVQAEPGPPGVIVVLHDAAPPVPSPSGVRSAQIEAAVSEVLTDVGVDQPLYRYQSVPAFAGRLSDDSLNALQEDPRVRYIIPDAVGHGADAESGALINLGAAQALGFSGEGVTIAVIDSGINRSHPDFAGAVVHEECFMASFGLSSRCPNGRTHQVGQGAAEDDHGHGTNVAGIAAGRGNVAPVGVAPDASLAIFKVLDQSNTFYLSDLYAVIDEIVANHPEIDIVNMSLGTFSQNVPGACTTDPFFDPLRAAGVLAFASSMNQRFKTGMGYPACVNSVVSVGAVYDSDMPSHSASGCTDSPALADSVTCWSNSDPTLDLLAPGCSIVSAGAFSATSNFCGTSQAAPHAAGAAALLMQQRRNAQPDEIESLLKTTGVPRTDPANGVTTPRIDVLAAVSFAIFGDVNCDFLVDAEDVALVLGYTAQVTGLGGGGCPPVGAQLGERIVGDVNCDGRISLLDALGILLYHARVEQPPGTPECPAIGDAPR